MQEDVGMFAIRLATAFALGIAVGLERQWRQRMAGLRTNALVALGAALFASIAVLMDARQNPTQVAAYIVSGVGFLAGAVIFKHEFSLRGLNTAATIWSTAAVGTLCGSGFLPHAAIGAVAILGANVLLRPIVERINRQPLDQSELSMEYHLHVTCREENESSVRSALLVLIQQTTLILRSLESRNREDGVVEVIAYVVTATRAEAKVERIVGKMSVDPIILSARWHVRQIATDDAAVEND